MEEKKKMNPTYSLTLPHDLIVEILLRLPVRSLLRFKRVCKSWLSLISDPQFAKSHFDLAASPTHRLLLNYTSGYQIESVDLDASLHDDSAIVNLNFPPPPPPSEYSIALPDNNSLEILCSCRGFILSSNQKGDLIVWNPATGVHKRISEYAIELGYDYLYGIGYDSSTDDYLIVLIVLDDPEFVLDNWQPRIEFFSLKTNSCYNIQGVNLQYLVMDLADDFKYGLHLNETLHWLVISCDTKLHVIIALDLIKSSLSEIPVPDDFAMESMDKTYCLRIMKGCLSLCYHGVDDRGRTTEIWVMKEYKVQSSWTKSFVVSTYDIPYDIFFPICFTRGGGALGADSYGRLMKLNDKGELLEHRTSRLEYKYNLPLFVMYRESLLSLPIDFEEASEDHQQ